METPSCGDLRRLVEQLPGVVYYRALAAPGLPTYVSPQIIDLLGYAPEEVLARDDVWTLDLGAADAAPGITEHRLRHRDGRAVWVRNIAMRAEGADGAPFVLGMLVDITPDKHQAALETRLRHFWDAGVVGIVTGTLDGRLLDANDAFLAISGYTREDLERGTSWFDLVRPERAADARAVLGELGRTGRHAPSERELVHRDGHLVPVLLGVAMLPGGECVALVHDLSARKRLEAQLQQAQRLESIGLLAGGIAHDLNNVLAAILLYAEAAEGQLAPELPVREDLAEIRQAAESARNITRQLLAFGRQQELQPQVIELGGVALGLEPMLRRLLGEDVVLTIRARASRHVLADLGQIEQVILNLAVNARDAMPTGGTLAIEVHDRGEAEVELRVADSGIGMDEATLARIFEPFFTTKEKGKGTGLGLSTVFGIVKQSGGAVWAESVAGEGATFHVTLPAVRAPAFRPRPTTLRSARIAARGETVLIVDDEPSIARGIQRVLEKAGYRTLVASSPGDALLLAERDGVDLLITDVVMPLLRGPDLADRLRVAQPNLRTLLITGYAGDPALPAALPKPFSPVELLDRVRAVLDGA